MFWESLGFKISQRETMILRSGLSADQMIVSRLMLSIEAKTFFH